MPSTDSSLSQIHAAKLHDLAQRLPEDKSLWSDVEASAKIIADELRSRHPQSNVDLPYRNDLLTLTIIYPFAADQRVLLGQSTTTAKTLSTLLKVSHPNPSLPPQSESIPALYHLLRVAANFCADNGQLQGI